MKKRILITGARAPAVLDLARHLRVASHEVYAADSVKFPLTRASKHILENLVFKLVFSRFASNTLISPTLKNLKKIKGKEYCTYSIAYRSKLVAHACYHPLYRVGLGAGIYFEPQYQETRKLD